jgi:lysophospholipase L1-like esterase
MTMKTVLCFGDSLTWGFDPRSGTRYPFDQRWPGVLQGELGGDVRVVEEALNGRTTIYDVPLLPHRSGREALDVVLESQAPVDVFAMMLGTNDVQPFLRATASDIAAGCLSLIWTVLKSQAGPGGQAPKVLLIAPPHLGEAAGLMRLFYPGGEETARQLAPAYRLVAEATGSRFLDAAAIVGASAADGVHLEPPEQRKLGLAVGQVVREMLA